MKKVIVCISTMVVLAACARKQTEHETDNFTVHGDTVIVPESSNLKGRLKVSVIQSEPYRLQMLTAGTVKAIPTQFAEIAPPFSGRVTQSYMKLGMIVSAGTPLFEISSPDFMTAQKIFFQQKSQMQLAEKTLKRQQDLIDHGVGTQKDLEEAQTAYEVARREYENAVVGIKIFKADPDNLALGQPLVVRSPIAGEILDNKIVVGKFINDNSSSVAIVAELSKVWVAGQIKEKDIRYIHALDECNIEVAALPEKHIKGKVFHVSELVDEDTRSVQVLIECDNKDHTLKPGMYVTANFINAPAAAIVIPAKAVLQGDDQSYVFREVQPGKYVRSKITSSESTADKIIVKSGLKDGDRVVTEGEFYLSAAK
ncbi:efflux RND transporter periplasmic adaptor subunit [Chitinophaga sp.]|uniref:efflux RND transporter periplasmic adaptor subunit n=1 Tax=Chitinophaga sp. TaxID=1869181 RepID=UPI0031CEA699